MWLLEELGIPYELKMYKRDENFRAPAELEKVHPLGKAPVVELIGPDGSNTLLAETGHIFEYLCGQHDASSKLAPATDAEKEKVGYYFSYAEGSLQWLLVLLLVNTTAKEKSPWFARFLVSRVLGRINSQYYLVEVHKNLAYLESVMAEQHAQNKKYFVGDKLTGADIILSFPLYENLFYNPRLVERVGELGEGLAEKYPHLKKWADDMSIEPGLLKASAATASES